jgi:hypothetical protein
MQPMACTQNIKRYLWTLYLFLNPTVYLCTWSVQTSALCVSHVLFPQKLSENISPNQPCCIYVLSPAQSEDFWRSSRRITYCSVQTHYWVMTSKQLLLLGNRFLISKYTNSWSVTPVQTNMFPQKRFEYNNKWCFVRSQCQGLSVGQV